MAATRAQPFVKRGVVPLLLVLIAATVQVWAQAPPYSSVTSSVRGTTIAVSFGGSKAEIINNALATAENLSLLANIKTICVLPFDGWNAKNVIDSLPSLTPIREGLQADKQLRQNRNDVSDQLQRYGFQVTDCVAGPSTQDAELLFTTVAGGGIVSNMNAYYWHLYAPERNAIVVHGESGSRWA